MTWIGVIVGAMDGTTTIVLPIEESAFWGSVMMLVMFGALGGLLSLLAKKRARWLDAFKADLDLRRLNSSLVLMGLVLWSLLVLILSVGLLWQVWQTAFSFSNSELTLQDTEPLLRSRLILLTALTATLGAVIVLPVTLRRLKLTRQQTRVSEEALFNEKITEAQRDLYAQRQVTKEHNSGFVDIWEDDIVRRNAAIDQLERLVKERPDVVENVASVLSVYVRELSKREPAEIPPGGATPEELRGWAIGLKLKRSDMEKAVQTLGRLRHHYPDLIIELRNANLQRMALDELDFEKARLSGAQLQGADLFNAQLQRAALHNAQLQGAYFNLAQMQGADLYGAQMQGAVLDAAQMQGASLDWAQMQGASLDWAQMQGTDLFRAQMDEKTSFSRAILRGAALREIDFTEVSVTQDQIDSVFGDASVDLPADVTPPDRFSREYATWEEFDKAWRAWQTEIGFDPNTPE